MFKTIDTKEKAVDFEKRVKNFWDAENISELSISNRSNNPRFVFFEGPPTANGKPGVHHVYARTLKDVVCRYKTMQGFVVKRKAGWDTHGLPVEIEVEKQLGLNNKAEVEEYGIGKFNKKCRESVFSYEKEWREMTANMGYWIDLENPYITLDRNYIESVWWILNRFFTEGLIYKGFKIVPYCPKCGTPLSSHEVAQGYQDTEDPSVFVKFKIKDKENTYFLAWTTTPWTLISNVALVVNPKETYAKVKINDEFLILAKARLSVLDEEYEIIEEYTGKDLEYTEYEQLFPFVVPEKKAFFVGCADYVSMDDGTGVVHTAPAFGQDDYELGKKYDLPMINPVDGSGCFTDVITDWKGEFVKDADKSIIRNLKERSLLYKRQQILHSYPFCWRCKSPLIYFARSSWYIKTSVFKEKMIENNDKVNWFPSFVGEKRFGEWLENNVDWALSRDRFWGTPLNIWVCPDCGKLESAGSIEELRQKGKMLDGSEVPADIDLHRPVIDDVVMTCECNATMKRTPEVIDCWFDSGSMPFAQWHYPFENKEIFDGELFPADFICEGIDQTRGWFYSLLAISTFLKGCAPYKNVLVNDLILDKKGKKMSKSQGNTVNPTELMNTFGADALRWYLLAVSPPWVPTKFDRKGVEEVVNKLIGTLKNIYSFFSTYANIDKYKPEDINNVNKSELDMWILSKLNNLVKAVIGFNDKYDFTRTVRAVQNFVIDDLSNWYVRRSRRRYWALTLTDDKKAAYSVLNFVLQELCKVMAPFAPFITEELYRNLSGGQSVHLTDYPKCDEGLINNNLEAEMDMVIRVVTMGRAARNAAQIKVRQTLGSFSVPAFVKPLISTKEELIKEEINIKEIEYLAEDNDLIEYDIKPNFKSLGPKCGKHMKNVSQALREVDGKHIVKAFGEDKPYYLECDGHDYHITRDDLFFGIKAKKGFVFEYDRNVYVALNTHLSAELVLEGYARELVNKIQFTRKEMDFDIMDKINVYFHSDEEIAGVFKAFADYIKTETLTEIIQQVDSLHPDMKKWDINGKEVFLSIAKL